MFHIMLFIIVDKVGLEENLYNLIKSISEKHTTYITLDVEEWKLPPYYQEKDKDAHCKLLLSNIM